MPQSSAPAHIRAIAPYQAGKPIEELAREYGLDPASIIKLASNENPLGCSRRVREALAQAAADLPGRYPDANGFDLKADLAAFQDVPMNWITLGNGSNDLLELASLALLDAGLSAVYAEHAFVVYQLSTQARGARHIMVPARDYGHDLSAMLDAIADDTRLVFIANPNNPTGTHLPAADVHAFLGQVRDRYDDRVTVLLDVAYDEYLDPAERADYAGWVREFPNLIVTRTFSKAYGLAGLRVGYALAQPALTDLLNRVRQPFNVGVLAQLAARVALKDTDFLAQTHALNRRGRAQLQDGFARLSLDYVPSHTNFVLVRVGDAAAVNEQLLRRGIIVRPVAGDGLPHHLRVTIGLPAENERLLQALAGILAE
ncbi:MAG: histidinol-phosphate transaminase [Castellaniella sp.]|uniref:histidinol-phosphate transaminase n=1 Tax=Castellaniella sp. TaxID=1955812 RepID=UPI001219E586|nr:histidinol-phosphate transaminase [Castellaniella sp.]TAN30932.1 MAG: histidinol-phosphate transaminase [Castellaniella sp.]